MTAAIIFAVCSTFLIGSAMWDKKRHWHYQWMAARRLNTLQKLRDNRERFSFLKKTHHFVFEEMILTAVKRKGHKIIRNKKYTGDGGIDGRVFIRGKLYLLQAKRYKGFIHPGDVYKFSKVCRDHNAGGLFVHTGKTCKKSWMFANRYGIKMVSGDKLLGLFKGV